MPKHCRSIGNISKGIIKIPGPLGLFHSNDHPCPLHFRHLQNLKNKTMAFSHLYEALIQLDQASKEEILWWRDHLQAWNGRALFQKPVELIIETDASRKGWGGILSRDKYRECLVLARKKVTNQLPRTLSRFISVMYRKYGIYLII